MAVEVIGTVSIQIIKDNIDPGEDFEFYPQYDGNHQRILMKGCSYDEWIAGRPIRKLLEWPKKEMMKTTTKMTEMIC